MLILCVMRSAAKRQEIVENLGEIHFITFRLDHFLDVFDFVLVNKDPHQNLVW